METSDYKTSLDDEGSLNSVRKKCRKPRIPEAYPVNESPGLEAGQMSNPSRLEEELDRDIQMKMAEMNAKTQTNSQETVEVWTSKRIEAQQPPYQPNKRRYNNGLTIK
ncbi:MAG: hypothetical protein PHC66_01100 [Candidatus Nanoarchaeia archaeon]|nr:hypothetical protein [Candidatus Nanoarchaeia archaeon]MDD5239092.1 hypothetical protein [Candidatus Nanoarchaeia archaeon]